MRRRKALANDDNQIIAPADMAHGHCQSFGMLYYRNPVQCDSKSTSCTIVYKNIIIESHPISTRTLYEALGISQLLARRCILAGVEGGRAQIRRLRCS